MEGSPEHPRTVGAGEGDLCSMTGSGAPQICKTSGCSGAPQGSAPMGLRGIPEPHVFHSALCLNQPRFLLPWKQNRGGGGRSEVSWGLCVGGGEVGLAGRCLGNGN